MKTKKNTDVVARLVAALDMHEHAKLAKPEDNPFHERELKDMVQNAGLLKSADKHPVKSMVPEGSAGYELEAARRVALEDEKVDKSAKRMAAARARAARKVQFDKIADAPVIPSKARMQEAWAVLFPMVPIVTKIADSKKRWSSRFLGSVADDIAQMALERMALVLAKSDRDLEPLQAAAMELGGMVQRTGQVPGDQLTNSERKERKAAAKNRKWLMGMANNRVMGALVDVYTMQHNLRWDNLDIITTVMANISGVGDDPLTARFKADRAPAFLGTKFTRPGGVDAEALAVAISAAITERGLDPMVEIILNEENRRPSDGKVKWGSCAKELFLATPGGIGEWAWDVVVKATAHHAKPKRAWSDAARLHTQNQFRWLPGMIVGAVEAFDPHFIGYSSAMGSRYAVMASDFELFYAPDPKTPREVLRPALRYADKREAAKVLAETLGELVTGQDLLNSLVNS